MAASAPALPSAEEEAGVGHWLRLLLELTKARITFAVTFSVATGWVLFMERFDVEILLPVGGVFLLACGAAALNHVQEWRVDAQMPRTMNRPIPSGRISPTGALVLAVLFMAVGINVLSNIPNHTWTILLLGAFAVLWYNGVYYALKRITAFAVVPGALIGAVPPIIGWCAAGGIWWDSGILEVAGFFFLWQIPHFWLLVHLYGTQYEGAGLPSPTSRVNPEQFRRITTTWTLAVAVCGLVLTVLHQLAVPWNFLVLGASIWISIAAVQFLRVRSSSPRALFMRLNAYALAVMLLLMADALAKG